MTTHIQKLDSIKERVRSLRQELSSVGEDVGLMQQAFEFEKLIASCVPAIIVDMESDVILASTPLADELFGYIPNELVGKLVHDLVPENLRSKHQEHTKAYSVDPKSRQMGDLSMELFGVKKDGTLIKVEIGLHPHAWGGKRLVIATILKMRS